jgi:hypothetical protein
MRTVIFIFMVLMTVPAFAQTGELKSLTLNDAVQASLKNNPALINDSIKEQLLFELKSNWNQWIFFINKTNTLRDYYHSLSDLGRITALRYESGEIDFNESASVMNKLAGIATNLAVSENNTRIYKNTVKQLIYAAGDITPADSQLHLYQIDKYSGSAEIPDYSDSSDAGYLKFVHELKVENMLLELDNKFIKLQYFRSFALEYASNLIAGALIKLKSEDIDYLEYAVFMSEAFMIRCDYLDTLNEYNLCAIKIEYYAY